MKNFNIREWRLNNFLTEEKEKNELVKIYEHLKSKLDKPAKDAGLRMSIFEQEFPTASSFMVEINKITSLFFNIPNNEEEDDSKTEYEIEYWFLTKYGWDFTQIKIKANSEEEALKKAQEQHRLGKRFKIINKK